MDRGMNRSTSTPYLPRYQSLSPARSPLLGGRRFTSLRSISQPSQRIYYIDNSPARVINSYHVHHKPSPNKTYKIHLCSSKTNHYLTRVTRSQSAYDINSSHVYTSQEDISYKPLQETTERRAGSCEDLYHKTPFFPDTTPSESGVSFGESEEGSTFGGEDDNVSQHSFDSSSAFYEVTVDSELDKCDSDNFSGPDYCIGDRTLGILHENDENVGRRKLGQGRPYREPHSSDSSLLSRVESRTRESASRLSWDFDKSHSRAEALRVIIPESESIVKTSMDSNKPGDRRAVSSTPLAHSTPHVSPGGPEELKLRAGASWNADDPLGEATCYSEVRKYATAGSMFEPESDAKLLFKLEDSSCASSCSEDNYSDVSNITISSQGSRKTKLVKKHSDKPASAKRNSLSYLSNLTGTVQTVRTSSDNSADTCPPHGNITSENLSGEDSGCFTSTHSNSESYKDRQVVANSVKYGEIMSKDGKDWWTAYNMNTATEQEDKVESEMCDNRDKLFSFQREIRVVKPLTVNIPLISAGKHGQEKLRRFSQTPQSPSRSPPLSQREADQTWDSGMIECHTLDDCDQTNIDGQQKSLGRQFSPVDHSEYHTYEVGGEEESELTSFLTGQACEQPVMPVVTQDGLSGLRSQPNSETSQSELCFESVLQESEHMCSEREELEINSVLEDKADKMAHVKELQFCSSEEIDSMKGKPDSFPSHNFGISGETAYPENNVREANSTDEIIWPVDIHASLVTEQVIDSTNVENITDINQQLTEPRLGALTCSDELDSAGESLLETQGTPDSAGLPALSSPVSGSDIPRGASCLPRKNNYLGSEISVSKTEIVSEQELTESDALVTVLGENTYVHLDTNIHEHSLDKANLSDNTQVGQGQFSVGGLCFENTVSTSDTDIVVVRKKSYTAGIDDSDFLECAAIIDPLAGCIVIKEAEQQQGQGLSRSFENTSTVDSGVTTENADMEDLVEPGMRANLSPLECWETPQKIVHVIATAQRSEDSIKNMDSPLHRNSWVSHHSPSSLLSLSDLNDNNSERADTITVLSQLPQDDKQDSVDQQITTNSDVNKLQVHNKDETSYSLSQQEAAGTSVCTDISRPVDESINRLGNVALRGDKGFDKEEHFCTEKSARFVDRGEEFIHYPSVNEKLVVVTETSRRIEHSQAVTTERIVANVNRSSLELSCADGFSRVVKVSDNSAAETVVRKDEEYTIFTTDALYSHTGKEDTVAVTTDTCCLDVDINTPSRVPVSSLTITLSEPAAGQGIYGPIHSSESTYHHPSSSESTSRLAAQIEIQSVHSQNAEDYNKDLNCASADHVSLSTNNVCDTTNAEYVLASVGKTATADMPRSDHLDHLQAQLSLISNDSFGTRLNAFNESDQYQDHAEATSVLKQIVRGDTADFTHFSNTTCGSGGDKHFQDCFRAHESSVVVTGELNNKSEAGVDEWCDVVSCEARECYDNDYDYVTTDLPKGPKLFARPQHHPHLTKPGQYKSSSLWTLQEETESALNTSPRPSPKLPRVTFTSQEDTCTYKLAQSPPSLQANLVKEKAWNAENESKKCTQNLVLKSKILRSESSDFEDSDGNYSSRSTPDSDSRRSSSFGREQTPLSEAEYSTVIHQDDKIDYKDASEKPDINYMNIFSDRRELDDFTTDCVNKSRISVPSSEDRQISTSLELEEESEPHMTNFSSSMTFSISSPERKDDCLSPLDRLCASLEQFTEPSNDGWRLILLAENATPASDSRESDMSISTAHMTQNSDDDTISETSWRHTLGLDTSRGSPTPTDASDGSMYTSTGRAEIKKTSSFQYDIPEETSLNTDLKRIAVGREDLIREEKIKQFENLLDEFSKSILPNAVISEFIFLREKRSDRSDSSASSSEDLYKSFTNEDSEKKQNHVCIVVEDESMNTFRFKRYLKKSHTKRKKGKKVLRFLSKLGCVSEALNSPISSPNQRLKQSDEDAQVFSSDSLATSKHTVSNPIMISSTSFHHRNILNTSPLIYTDDCSTPFSSNRSLDSIRSKADSAYSSISESVAGTLNSPASQRGPSTSFRVPPASSGSVSSVFCSGSTSGEWSFSDNVFSGSVDDAMHTSDSFSKQDLGYHTPGPSAGADSDMMSALSDVFDQLNVCEGEIDSALLNRVRHGHVKAKVDKQ